MEIIEYLPLDGEGTSYGRTANHFLFLNIDNDCSCGGKMFGKAMDVGIGRGDGFYFKDGNQRGRGDGVNFNRLQINQNNKRK